MGHPSYVIRYPIHDFAVFESFMADLLLHSDACDALSALCLVFQVDIYQFSELLLHACALDVLRILHIGALHMRYLA
jgi:hypothetical protein